MIIISLNATIPSSLADHVKSLDRSFLKSCGFFDETVDYVYDFDPDCNNIFETEKPKTPKNSQSSLRSLLSKNHQLHQYSLKSYYKRFLTVKRQKPKEDPNASPTPIRSRKNRSKKRRREKVGVKESPEEKKPKIFVLDSVDSPPKMNTESIADNIVIPASDDEPVN